MLDWWFVLVVFGLYKFGLRDLLLLVISDLVLSFLKFVMLGACLLFRLAGWWVLFCILVLWFMCVVLICLLGVKFWFVVGEFG